MIVAYFAVSYQLNNKKEYQLLWDEMERLGAHKVMRSLYFLDVNIETASGMRDHLCTFIDSDDAVAVVEVNSQPAHKMGYNGTNDWIKTRFGV
tara:strand:+ start:89 stop:367 length:279 start_codon:yes stop_codon:yes gene_type:complete